MKPTRLILHITTLIIIAISSIMCSEAPQTVIIRPEQNEQPTYTIIYYAVGGETLDKGIEESIVRASNTLAKNVKMTGCIKWTKGYSSGYSDGEGNVSRFILDNDNRQLMLDKIGDNDYNISNPENIADFIAWSKSVAPSDHYILAIAGHGNGWHPDADATTRGTLRDTDMGHYTSLTELCEGIELSQTKFRMIYMISCSMNTLEYITPLSQYADYILASSHISVMLSSEFAHLKQELRNIKKDDNFVNTIGDFLNDIGTNIKGDEGIKNETLDFILTDTSKIEMLNGSIANFCDSLMEIYDRGDEDEIANLEAEIAKAYYLSQENMIPEEYERKAFTYDIVDIARCAARGNKELEECAKAIEQQAKEARIRYCIRNLPTGVSDIYYGVTLTNATLWEARRYEEAGYEETLFNQTTNWSKFLKRNNITVKY